MTTANAAAWAERLRVELRAERLLPNLTAGLIIGISEVLFAISLGNLLFSSDHARYAAAGMGIALFSAAVMMIIVALTSSIPGVMANVQEGPIVVLAVVAASLFGALSASSPDERLATVLVVIALTSLLTGLLFLALGVFKLGGLVRFLPYPVVGGFLAGTGWLLFQGAISVMVGSPLTLAAVPTLLQPDQLLRWVPGVVLAALLFVALRRSRHFLTMPAVLAGSIVIFYIALLVSGASVDQARTLGLLPGSVSQEMFWQPLNPARLLEAKWGLILRQSGTIATILMVSAVSLLLNASALELVIQQDVDLNRELRAAGLANLVSGLGGGMSGYHLLGSSTLSHRIGSKGRLAGVVAGGVCIVMLVVGAPLLVYFPIPVQGGILAFLGLGFLYEWVIEGWSRLPRADYAVVIVILAVIALTDFLVGVGVGLVAATGLFLVNYSRINVVHHALSGVERTSSVERPPYHRHALSELGQQIYVLELQGFIFFGTANSLLERLKARLSDPDQPPVRYIVLDFRRVIGLDSSAVLSFTRARQVADGRGVMLVLSHVAPDIRRRLEQGDLSESSGTIRYFPDLDHGVEWCEEELLRREGVTNVTAPATLPAQLKQNGFDANKITRLMSYLERKVVDDGMYVIRQGEAADDLYFIEVGQVSIYLEMNAVQRVRLGVQQMGTLVGELGLYFSTPRTASVITNGGCIVYRLSREALAKMKADDPDVAAAFHEYIVRQLAERLMSTNRLVEALVM